MAQDEGGKGEMSDLANNCSKSFLSYGVWLLKWKIRNLKSLFPSITIFTWGVGDLLEEGVKVNGRGDMWFNILQYHLPHLLLS